MNDPAKPTIAAVIVTWNPLAPDVLACAESLLLQVDTIIYSDNGSNAETETLLKDLQSKHENIVCLWNGGNLGIATALNRGVAEARRRGAGWVMTLDHDSVPEKDMVRTMFRAYGNLSEQVKETVGILCPNFMLVKGVAYRDTIPHFIETTITSGQLVKIGLFDKIGGYEDDLFVECVDHEFCFRALAHGYRTFLAPDAMLRQRIGNPVIEKLFGKTFIVPNYPPVRYYYQVRNSVVIYLKYFWVVPGWVLGNIPPLVYSLIKVVLYEKDPVKKICLAARGAVDGLRGKMGKYGDSKNEISDTGVTKSRRQKAWAIVRHDGIRAFLKFVWDRLLSKYDHLGLLFYFQAASGLPKEAEKNHTVDSAVAFPFQALGGLITPVQAKWELTKLAAVVRTLAPRVVVEIGTARGGTLFTFSRLAQTDATIVSIDLPGGDFGGGYPAWKESIYKKFASRAQNIHLLRADSHRLDSVAALEKILASRKIDFLFIDGDHLYEGVAKDYANYAPLVRPGGVIAFHDIRSPDPTYGVPRLWNELKQRFPHEEFLEPEGVNMGIGVLYV